MLDFTEIFSLDNLFGNNNDSSNPIMWLVWIVPIVIFVFYGQRIQLMVTSSEINKGIEKLYQYKEYTRKELLGYLENKSSDDNTKRIDSYLEYFTIMPVDLDPTGIMPKIKHLLRSREDYTRNQVLSLVQDLRSLEASNGTHRPRLKSRNTRGPAATSNTLGTVLARLRERLCPGLPENGPSGLNRKHTLGTNQTHAATASWPDGFRG